MQLALWGKRVVVLLLCLLLSLPAVNPAAFAATQDDPPTFDVSQPEKLTLSGYQSGTKLVVYNFSNGAEAWSQDNVTDPSITIDLMPRSGGYYVKQITGGYHSGTSTGFNTTLLKPTLSADTDTLILSGIPAGRTFDLYLNGPPTLVNVTPTYDATNQVYRYENLEPNSRAYYAVQTYNGVVSEGSNLLSPTARVPVATGGIEYLDVSNTYANATFKLYKSGDPNEVAITPTYNATEQKWRFANVPTGDYYVVQTINGIESSSNVTNVTPDLPAPPSLTSKVESLDVSGILPNATLKLYTSKSVFVDEYLTTGAATYTISNLLPHEDSYYVTQTVNAKESSNSNIVNTTLHIPTATAGEGYIDVTNVTPGATLHLYEADTSTRLNSAVAVEQGQGSGNYRFENVVPRKKQYYVTQSLPNGIESLNTAFLSPTLPKLSLTGGTDYIEVSNAYPGATLELYDSQTQLYAGTLVPGQDAGTYRYTNVPEGTNYTARQTINDVVSDYSNPVNVGFPQPAKPILTAGEEKLTVSGYETGATLKLYLVNDTPNTPNPPIQTFTNVTGSTYEIPNVEPNSKEYYVTQTVNGKESDNSQFSNSTLRTPVLTGGTDYIEVSNMYPGASIELYDGNPGVYRTYTYQPSQPPVPGDSTYRFENVPEGSGYYAIQRINGVVSTASLSVSVAFPVPAAPIMEGQEESLRVSSYETGATLKLYVFGNPVPIATIPAVATDTYTFENILPNLNPYYVTQTVNGKESQNSEFVNSKLRIPAVTPILGAIEVRGVSANTVLKLRNAATSALVSDQPEDLGGGVYRFNVTEPLAGAYYVTQSAGTIESENSVFVNPILPKPTVTANGRTAIHVGNLYPGASLKLYNKANGREVLIQAISAGNGVYRFENVSAGRYYVDQLVNGIPSPHSDVVEVLGPEIIINPSPVTPTPSPSTPNTPVDILVNGQVQKVGTLASTTENGQTVQTIRVNSDFVRNLLNESASGAIVTIPFATASSDAKTVGEVDDSLIRLMQSKNATLSLQTPIAEYRIPAASIRLASEGTQNGSGVQITIAPATPDETSSIDSFLSARTSKRIASPVSFGIVASSGGTTVETNRFSNYVERLLPIPASAGSGDTITAVVWDNGTLRHVPTRIVTQDGVRYASVKSFGGETLALVEGRSSFGDLAGNWAQSAVEDMASRLIVQGTGSGSFEPARSVNRAEFAAILAAGLGLSADNAAASGFADVSAGDWFSRDVAAAAQYGLINGFGDGTFRPDKTITRAEAMAMLARAMKVSGLSAASADTSTLGTFADQADVPEWAREAAAANVQAGLIEGTEQQRLVPGANLSRAEAAALIRRLLAESGLI